MSLPAGEHWLHNVEVVAYHDLDGRPGFKLGLQEVSGSWYLYVAHLWQPGWSIIDVTDPSAPRLVRSLDGPANTWTIQMQIAGGRMITALQKIDDGWGGDTGAPFDEGFLIWDVGDPEDPRSIGKYSTRGEGTHRNFYAGGHLVHSATAAKGFDGHIYEIVDISDPSAPSLLGRWWIDGQWIEGGEVGVPDGTSLHAPYVDGDRAFLAYGAAGMVILDVSDPASPHLVSRLDLSPPFNPIIAAHTAMPLPARGLAAVNSEAIEEGCQEPLCFAGLVDISDERDPRVLSTLPVPAPPPSAAFSNFCEHGGRFGPHNLHQPQGQPALLDRDDVLLLTYFNAGLRVYDIADPRLPREVASFVPPDPRVRRGVLPSKLVTQSEDVLADSRGFIFVTDKNHGLYVVRVVGP